jgi:hypothetical protein
MARFTSSTDWPPREYEFCWRWGWSTPQWFDDLFMGNGLWMRLRRADLIRVRRPRGED